MKTILYPPHRIHEIGRRENNEDCIFPRMDQELSIDNRLFLVCDGVGGMEKGEVASLIVCNTFSDVLRQNIKPTASDIDYAVKVAEQRIDQYIGTNKDLHGMATTLTMLMFHTEGATIAHIGDSRVYHVRSGEIIHKTEDHSLVNELVSKKIITADEALIHPKRNVITKAISGHENHQVADIFEVSDLKKGDYFFLCSDGISESVTDLMLLDILTSEVKNEQKIEEIKSICSDNSKDNYSAYLVQVKNNNSTMGMGSSSSWFDISQSKQGNLLLTTLAVVVGLVVAFFISGDIQKEEVAIEKEKMDAAIDKLESIDIAETYLFSDPDSSNGEHKPIDSLLNRSIRTETDIVVYEKEVQTNTKKKRKNPKKRQNETLSRTQIERKKNVQEASVHVDSYSPEEAKELLIENGARKRKLNSVPSRENVDPEEFEVEKHSSEIRDGKVSIEKNIVEEDSTKLLLNKKGKKDN